MIRRLNSCLLALGVLLFALGVTVEPVKAQEWPNRPVKIIIPYPPGGQTDIVARWLGEKLKIGRAHV